MTPKSISAGGENLGDVVIDGESHYHHDADEADLEHRFLDIEAQIALHRHFHQQHQNHAAIQNRNGQQVEDGEVEAHHAHQLKELRRTFAGRGARQGAYADGARQILGRHAALQHPFEELHDQERAFAVGLYGFAERGRVREFGPDDAQLLLRNHADHPSRRHIHAGKYRRYRDHMRLAVPLVLDLDGLAAAVLRNLLELDLRVNRLAVDRHQQIALLEPCLVGRHAGFDTAQLDLAALVPAGEAHAGTLPHGRRHGSLEVLAVALDGEVHGAVGAGDFLEANVFPGRVLLVVEPDDAVVVLNAGLGGWRIDHHVTDNGLHVLVGHFLELEHVEAGEQRHGQHHIHQGPGESDDQSLPAGLGKEAARVVGVFVRGLFAGHLDVAAQQDQREAVIGIAAAESKQAGTKPEAEGFHLHIEIAGGPEVAQFVDHDHDPNQNQQPQNVFTKEEHIASSCHSAGHAGRCQFARHGARCPVNLQDIANRARRAGGHPGQRLLNNFVYGQIADPALQKSLYCYLIGRI